MSCEYRAFSGLRIPILRPEEPYRMCVCVCAVPPNTVRYNCSPLHLQSVGRRGHTVRNKGRKEERYFKFINLFVLSTVFFVLCLLVTFKQFLISTFLWIESRWGGGFPQPSRTAMGQNQLLHKLYSLFS